MTTYRHERVSAQQGKTVDIPDDAVGLSVETFSDMYSVNYLVPVEGGYGQ